MNDSDCFDYPYNICEVKTLNVCVHKKVWPVTASEIFGLFFFAVFMALSNIAGVGGGGVAVPLLMGFFHFSTKPSISISSFAITITTLARFTINFTKKHPEKPN